MLSRGAEIPCHMLHENYQYSKFINNLLKGKNLWKPERNSLFPFTKRIVTFCMCNREYSRRYHKMLKIPIPILKKIILILYQIDIVFSNTPFQIFGNIQKDMYNKINYFGPLSSSSSEYSDDSSDDYL